jgi:hypothetical protein
MVAGIVGEDKNGQGQGVIQILGICLIQQT